MLDLSYIIQDMTTQTIVEERTEERKNRFTGESIMLTKEESIIHDAIRNLKVIKELLDIDSRPVPKESDELKFLMQDVIIIYKTLEEALDLDFIEHARPIIQEVYDHFLKGLKDSKLIWDLYMKIFSNAIVYGMEEALAKSYGKSGLDIHDSENWPLEKVNWVPQDLKERLIPPIKNLFSKFGTNLEKK